MKVNSLLFLSLAVLATTFVPSVHASEAPVKEFYLYLGKSQSGLVFNKTKVIQAILSKLLPSEKQSELQYIMKATDRRGIQTKAQGKYREAIMLLNTIDSNNASLEDYTKDKANTTGTLAKASAIYTLPSWTRTKLALGTTSNFSFDSFLTLYKATVQVVQDELNKGPKKDSKNSVFSFGDDLELLIVPCKEIFMEKCREHFIKNNTVNLKEIVDFMIDEGLASFKDQQDKCIDLGLKDLLESIQKQSNLAYVNGPEAYKAILQRTLYKTDHAMLAELQDWLHISDAEAKKISAEVQVTSTATPATTPQQKPVSATEVPALNAPTVPPVQQAATQAPVTIAPSAQQTSAQTIITKPVSQPEHLDKTTQSVSKSLDTNFVNRHPWVKYGLFVLAGAALVCSYRAYRNGSLRALAKLVKIRA